MEAITMNILGKVVRSSHRAIYKTQTRKQISRLQGKNDRSLKSCARAIDAVLKNDVSDEEKIWIDKIEALRNTLNCSSEEISITDYGAGSPDINLTAEQMCQGRVRTRTVGELCRSASKSYRWALMLFKLVREFRPLVCLELGTCLGISTAYQAAALELNQGGRITTLEGAPSVVSLAMHNFRNLGLESRVTVIPGRFQDTLQNILNEQKEINFAFIDGHHDEDATLGYFEQISSFLSDEAVVVFDDISWSKGMERAWNAIAQAEHTKVSLDLFSLGICILTKSPEEKFSSKVAI
jgi:precorrin-6B methylase 2